MLSISVQSEKSHLFWTSYSKLLHWLCAIAQRMQDSHKRRGLSRASSDNHPSSPVPSHRAWALSRADIPWDKQSKLWSGFTAVETVKAHLKAMPMLLQTCTRDWTDHGGYGIFFYLWPCCTKKYDSRTVNSGRQELQTYILDSFFHKHTIHFILNPVHALKLGYRCLIWILKIKQSLVVN